MLNNVVLVGRVARDIELKKTTGGNSFTTIVLAVDRDYVSKDGKRETDFINIEVWNGRAEYCARNIEKGRLISVQGSMKTNKYETKDGQKRVNTVVLASRIATLEKPRKANINNNVNVNTNNMFEKVEIFEDDVPF